MCKFKKRAEKFIKEIENKLGLIHGVDSTEGASDLIRIDFRAQYYQWDYSELEMLAKILKTELASFTTGCDGSLLFTFTK